MGKKKRRAERNQREQIQKMQDFTSGMVTDYKGQVADQQGAVDAAMSDYKDFDFTNPFADLTNPYAGIRMFMPEHKILLRAWKMPTKD